MKSKNVKRYICDHCNKYMYSAGGMTRHELRCTLNRNRSCAVCSLQQGWAEDHQGLSEIIKLVPIPNRTPFGDIVNSYYEEVLKPKMPEIRAAAANCPACIMAALRLSKIPVPIVECFNFTEEMQVILHRIRNERHEEYSLIFGC